jgi:hypothetical protein
MQSCKVAQRQLLNKLALCEDYNWVGEYRVIRRVKNLKSWSLEDVAVLILLWICDADIWYLGTFLFPAPQWGSGWMGLPHAGMSGTIRCEWQWRLLMSSWRTSFLIFGLTCRSFPLLGLRNQDSWTYLLCRAWFSSIHPAWPMLGLCCCWRCHIFIIMIWIDRLSLFSSCTYLQCTRRSSDRLFRGIGRLKRCAEWTLERWTRFEIKLLRWCQHCIIHKISGIPKRLEPQFSQGIQSCWLWWRWLLGLMLLL